MRKLVIILILLFQNTVASSSHMIGGDISYTYLGNNNYRIKVTYFRDCLPPSLGGGNPQAFFADGPIFLSIFRGDQTFYSTVALNEKSNSTLNPFGTPLCVTEEPLQCVNKAVYEGVVNLPADSNGYKLINQRCCLNDYIENINNPGGVGHTLIAEIKNLSIVNNSAVFREDIGPVLCINYSQTLNVSATDADGDSLSYSLCDVYNGGSVNDPKPTLSAFPNLLKINYKSSYNFLQPMDVALASDFYLNATSGILTVKPNQIGFYLVGICCTEWRNGLPIQENIRYVVIRVADCKSAVEMNVSANIITPYNCIQQVRAQGANFYKWSITPSNQNLIYLDNDSIANPTILFNQNASQNFGQFRLSVIGTDANGCSDYDSIQVNVTNDALFFIPNAFSPNQDGKNDLLKIHTSGFDLENIKIFNRWGNKVFESNSIELSWNGRYNGKEATADNYYWVAIIRDKQGNRITKKGTVLIVR